MNRLSTGDRARILAMMVEGMSIRSITRLTGASKNTVTKLLADAGRACSLYQSQTLVDLPCKRLQCDEIWSFVYARDKNVPEEMKDHPGVGSVWTWTAVCADTKLVPTWFVSDRSAGAAWDFMQDLAARLRYRVQLTTDGHAAYIVAVEDAFGGEIDYAQLIKVYGADKSEEKRYSPAVCTGTERKVISGQPDRKHISTSYVERQNLTMRMSLRRFTRLTNAFSKKAENHGHALSIYFMHYNFARVHQTLRVTPAMEAGVSDHVWSMEEIAALIEARETSPEQVTRKGWETRKSAK